MPRSAKYLSTSAEMHRANSVAQGFLAWIESVPTLAAPTKHAFHPEPNTRQHPTKATIVPVLDPMIVNTW